MIVNEFIDRLFKQDRFYAASDLFFGNELVGSVIILPSLFLSTCIDMN